MPHSIWIREGIESSKKKKKKERRNLSADTDTDTEMNFKVGPKFQDY